MITQDIENMKKNGFVVEEIPTGYIFSKEQDGGSKLGNILIHKEACEIIQKVDGERVRIVILRAIIGSG